MELTLFLLAYSLVALQFFRRMDRDCIVRKKTNYHLLSRNERNTKLLVDHEGEDSHLGSTSLVELNGPLLELLVGTQLSPSVVDESVTEISDEFSSSNVFHDSGEVDRGIKATARRREARRAIIRDSGVKRDHRRRKQIIGG